MSLSLVLLHPPVHSTPPPLRGTTVGRRVTSSGTLETNNRRQYGKWDAYRGRLDAFSGAGAYSAIRATSAPACASNRPLSGGARRCKWNTYREHPANRRPLPLSSLCASRPRPRACNSASTGELPLTRDASASTSGECSIIGPVTRACIPRISQTRCAGHMRGRQDSTPGAPLTLCRHTQSVRGAPEHQATADECAGIIRVGPRARYRGLCRCERSSQSPFPTGAAHDDSLAPGLHASASFCSHVLSDATADES